MKGWRICWPGPDAVCLQGGCLYCVEGELVSLSRIWAAARSAGLERDYVWGRQHEAEAHR